MENRSDPSSIFAVDLPPLAAVVLVLRLVLVKTASYEECDRRPVSSMLFISSHLLKIRPLLRRKESPELEDMLKKVSVSKSSPLVNHALLDVELWLTETSGFLFSIFEGRFRPFAFEELGEMRLLLQILGRGEEIGRIFLGSFSWEFCATSGKVLDWHEVKAEGKRRETLNINL